MNKNTRSASPDLDRFAQRITELRQALQSRSLDRLILDTGATFISTNANQGEFHLPLWSRPVRITYPAFIAYPIAGEEPLPSFLQAMLLYYFNTADGTPPSEQWISFADLPDGRFYNQAFQSYTGAELVRRFKDNPAAFEQAALRLGGIRGALGDASFVFQALPRVALLVVIWQGDEDFPCSFQVLFDNTASHYLPTDGYAILGSTITHRLIADQPNKPS
ncbi:MAG: DUF3786 domain-containing protein [Anaerolineales bacterium]|nr:DUF3786 domain-containing protein [Anaerolineales bacterium]